MSDVFDNGEWGLAAGVPYRLWLAGPDGASFELFPRKGHETEDDVKNAKFVLRRSCDVVSIRVTWTTIHDLQKRIKGL
jgi:hypothetical protein